VKITLCVPTRGRAGRFSEMVASALQKADRPQDIEIIARRDADDKQPYPELPRVKYITGLRPLYKGQVRMAGLWTEAWEAGDGDIAMMCGDDVTFITQGWDESVRAAFERVPDRVLMAYTRTGHDPRPLLPFVSRQWIEAAGFVPSHLQGWFSDEWIWSIAATIGRVAFIEDVLISHDQFQQMDGTYQEAIHTRDKLGGLENMRRVFWDIPEVKKRDERATRLQMVMDREKSFVPTPMPDWYTQSVTLRQQARDHEKLIRENTLIAVHCYAGDKDLVKQHMPLYKHHGAKVVVLSPTDKPVNLRMKNVECRQAGKAAYFGQTSLDRQRAHLQLLLEYPQEYFLLNDADSFCIAPIIPRYVYEDAARGVVFSNEVTEWRPHASPYPKIGMHPPYFLHRNSIERMLQIDFVSAHPITPYIDWYMVALTCESGLGHRNYNDGASFPAWRHDGFPETQSLGHDYRHPYLEKGEFPGDQAMANEVARGVVFIHSVKHASVMKLLLEARQRYVDLGSQVPHTITMAEYAEQTLGVREYGGFFEGDTIRI